MNEPAPFYAPCHAVIPGLLFQGGHRLPQPCVEAQPLAEVVVELQEGGGTGAHATCCGLRTAIQPTTNVLHVRRMSISLVTTGRHFSFTHLASPLPVFVSIRSFEDALVGCHHLQQLRLLCQVGVHLFHQVIILGKLLAKQRLWVTTRDGEQLWKHVVTGLALLQRKWEEGTVR
jgi:hypothetical protein